MISATVTGYLAEDIAGKDIGSGTVYEGQITVRDQEASRRAGESRRIWLDFSVWGRLGENLQKYVQKGDWVTLSGMITQEEWQARDGSGKRSKWKMQVRDYTLIPSRRVEIADDVLGDAQAIADELTAAAKPRPILSDEEFSGDLPF